MARTEDQPSGAPAPPRPRASSGRARAQDAQPERSGEDARRRGWFWHWNTIITQFAPLIGLKGVGLLNSYTVWTDRRDDSPYHGYAFPSQQAEATFYGEERAELITINKILVALDLIEIRKEMVTRADEAGRRWKVPHNFYRVKDRPDGFALTPEAVLRVVELAARDQAVYRYIRHIFSTRFAPIDRDNVWHQILPLVRQHPTWQRLAARAADEEARASARTRAGHARRRQLQSPEAVTDSHDRPAESEAPLSSVGGSNHGSQPAVAPSNNGPPAGVARSNSGSAALEEGSVDGRNEDRRSSVAQSNTTYNQEQVTTTTTERIDHEGDPREAVPPAPATVSRLLPPAELASGPLPEPSPEVVTCYEAANGRPATPLERQLLGELEREFSEAVRSRGAEPSDWLVAAIREAVSSGSSFVAPKRIREILARWVAEGVPGSSGPIGVFPEQGDDPVRPGSPADGREVNTSDGPSLVRMLDSTSVPPRGSRLRRGQQIDARRAMQRPISGSSLEAQGAIDPGSPASGPEFASLPPEVVQRLATALTAALGIPIQFVTPASQETAPLHPPPATAALPDMPTVPPVHLPGGLTNHQLWAMAQELLQARLSAASFESWIRPAVLLGVSESGDFLVGAPSQAACRRLEGRLRPAVEVALSELLGRPVAIRAVVLQEWFRRAGVDRSPEQDESPASPG
ncbi:hypothetical protein NET02_13765 [Thermomicrobiaceae bacterium CFH 74404]|uniref:DnaA N-terminal domain-containing protein n=1 Tax=Thermalbibacter longus TaxID=2951981 RepID=A0AA41WHM9_9BACT|nr:hypothetical protein [Thermalbibacter longus]MCM8750215.1 hypothetical protein [Thermalbibacter longus]